MSAQKTAPASPLKRWQFRRNLLICMAYQQGASLRLLADVFDITPKAVFDIVREYHRKYAGGLPTRIVKNLGRSLLVEISPSELESDHAQADATRAESCVF